MIPESFITEWRQHAPWQTNDQIEQDLVICRALVDIFSDEIYSKNLAFRGGTALHKLIFPEPVRYSEDIDLVQTAPEPIGDIFDTLREKFNYLGTPKIKQKQRNNTLLFKFESEILPKVPLRLKVEINCREQFTVLGINRVPFQVKSRWFTGKCLINSFTLEELLGSKLRALYQRKKGRDLFDLWLTLSQNTVDIDKTIKCFREFMKHSGTSVTRKQFKKNMELKIKDPLFLGDTEGLLRPGYLYKPDNAWKYIESEIIEKL
jgi:predicted nucleotidyltransferase component of viral defense system